MAAEGADSCDFTLQFVLQVDSSSISDGIVLDEGETLVKGSRRVFSLEEGSRNDSPIHHSNCLEWKEVNSQGRKCYVFEV
jgi:hypothetical protein